MAGGNLSNDEMKSLMSKNTKVNTKKITSQDFLNYINQLSASFIDDFSKELEKYVGVSLSVQLKDLHIDTPKVSSELNYEQYSHIESKDRFNEDRRQHVFAPSDFFATVHEIKQTGNEYDINRIASKILNVFNNAMKVYDSIELPLFEVTNVESISDFPVHLSNENYLELIMTVEMKGQEYLFVQLLSYSIVLELVDSFDYSQPGGSKGGESKGASGAAAGGLGGLLEEQSIEFLYNVPLQLKVVLGNAQRTVKEVLSFSVGQVIELDRLVDAPLDIYVNNQLVAKGEVVVVDDNFAIKIVDLIHLDQESLI